MNKIVDYEEMSPAEMLRTIFDKMDEAGEIIIPDLYYDFSFDGSFDEVDFEQQQYIHCKFNLKADEIEAFIKEFENLNDAIVAIAGKEALYKEYQALKKADYAAKIGADEDRYYVCLRLQRLFKLQAIGAPKFLIDNEARMAAQALMMFRYAEFVEIVNIL